MHADCIPCWPNKANAETKSQHKFQISIYYSDGEDYLIIWDGKCVDMNNICTEFQWIYFHWKGQVAQMRKTNHVHCKCQTNVKTSYVACQQVATLSHDDCKTFSSKTTDQLDIYSRRAAILLTL